MTSSERERMKAWSAKTGRYAGTNKLLESASAFIDQAALDRELKK